jgi:hypothetical protein
VRVLPVTTRTFTKDANLLKNGRGADWHVRIKRHGVAGERHGRCMACVNEPSYSCMLRTAEYILGSVLLEPILRTKLNFPVKSEQHDID